MVPFTIHTVLCRCIDTELIITKLLFNNVFLFRLNYYTYEHPLKDFLSIRTQFLFKAIILYTVVPYII